MPRLSVKRQSLTEQIKAILLDRIVNGILLPGDRLKELQIAQEFGTSQAPVREALRSLQALGYVEHKAHVGALVKRFTKKEIEEAFQIREALEGHCIMLAASTDGLSAQLDRQLAIMADAVENNDVKRFTKADNSFHRAIIEHANNARMLEIWDSLKIQLQVIATLTEKAVPVDVVYRMHLPIVEALKNSDRKSAARLLASHYQETGDFWKEHVRNV